MDVRILGPLVVSLEGRPVELGAGRQQAVFLFLVVHRNERVPIARLVDELWEGEPPETATKIVQNAVSLIRRALRAQRSDTSIPLLTEGRSYLLRLEPGELDVDRFDALVRDGRERLTEGDPVGAAVTLRQGLALWRGAPLAEVADHAFVRAEIARLEESRIAALEERVEADLACGRHAELVGELESLVAAHPYRERLRGQLMLALYRSGRQADALDSYRSARRHLVHELGLEPGPSLRSLEGAILRQDPSLDAPEPPRAAAPRAARVRAARKRTKAAFAVLCAVALVAAVAAALALSEPESAAIDSPLVAPNSVVVIDPERNAVADVIRVGAEPGPIAVGGGSVWVANVAEQTISRIEAATREVVATIGIGVEPSGLYLASDSLWIAAGRSGALLRVDTSSNRVAARFPVHQAIGPLPEGYDTGPTAVTGVAGSIWLAHGEEVSRIDPSTGAVLATVPAGGNWSGAITAGLGAVWVAENDALHTRRARPEPTSRIVRVDPRSSTVVDVVDVPGLHPPNTSRALQSGALAVFDGSVWAVAPATDVLWRIQPGEGVRTIPAGPDPGTVAAGLGGVWVENHGDRTVVRIDPFSLERVATIAIGRPTRGIATGAGVVWVTAV
jgi:YVTN family beta-propeller protein